MQDRIAVNGHDLFVIDEADGNGQKVFFVGPWGYDPCVESDEEGEGLVFSHDGRLIAEGNAAVSLWQDICRKRQGGIENGRI